MDKPAVSLFFGAGAEVGYGLPSGGRFALDLFRIPVDQDKGDFKEQLKSLDNTSAYATKWLPDDYLKKRIHVFGKSDYEGIIASSLEYRKDDILSYLEQLDQHVLRLLRSWDVSEEHIRDLFRSETGHELGQILYGQAVKLNSRLAESVGLFNSAFFSAWLKLLELHPDQTRLQHCVRAILELLVGSCGQRLVAKLNEEVFESAPDKLSVFDDLSGIFSLNYHSVGQTGMDIVLGETLEPVTEDDSPTEIMTALCHTVLEDIYSRTLDYQALVDSHFRYLYNPKAHWARFTRIAIFLRTVRRYISKSDDLLMERLATGPGYYHDLSGLSGLAEITSVGTTNYNGFARDLVHQQLPSIPVYYLNGCVEEYYDPYCNLILEQPTEAELTAYPRMLVPLIFTQSGIKPLTSITMSRRYVELYDQFARSDIIAIIGYGFNGDDGHINGLFRSLAESGKRLSIFHYGNESLSVLKSEYQTKLRLSSTDQLDIFTVDGSRHVNGAPWWKALLEKHIYMQPAVIPRT
ncbi:hypothetical protein GRF59_22635 [Paenibacillus sp. HJL G12]|uniref:SIR2-like domain-containing protein n=1 Tax=Paenibacillus dendrobii TaxID=2691084 RepID=A0A7X3IMP5_9BACL|nr:hypothetical protein [Paenibacillus dendrobii]MWV46405.1 hypothetical protein [Paenibacillus dendrobii]